MADYILAQTRKNIYFLVSQNTISQSDADVILSKLPDQILPLTPQNSEPHAPNGDFCSPTVQHARAIWGYNEDRRNPDDLSFHAGDVLEIVVETNADWWTGKWDGRTGLFPSNYVEKIPAQGTLGGVETQQSNGLDPSLMHPGSAPGGPYGQMPTHPAPYGLYQSLPNPHGPPQGYNSHEKYTSPPDVQQQQLMPVVVQQPPKKPGFGDKYGSTLAHSAVGGVGFGAGSAIGSGIINSIF